MAVVQQLLEGAEDVAEEVAGNVIANGNLNTRSLLYLKLFLFPPLFINFLNIKACNANYKCLLTPRIVEDDYK